MDLPGVYSLTAYSLDEVVARAYVVDAQPDVVVDVVDASNLERNLYLTVQLLEMQVKMVIALNMMDVAKARGHEIDIPRLSELLGVPVVPMVAARGEGVEELLDTVIKVAEGSLPSHGAGIHYGQDVENEITTLETAINGSTSNGKYSPRWLAVKLLENDAEIIEKVKQAGGK
jgi:ferrous iron transport protein B